MDDLASLDPELYKGLIFLKHYKGNFEDLSLNFTIAVEGELSCLFSLERVADHLRFPHSPPAYRTRGDKEREPHPRWREYLGDEGESAQVHHARVALSVESANQEAERSLL